MRTYIIFMAVVLIIVLMLSVTVRVLFSNPQYALFYAFRDAFFYILHKKWRNCQTGEIVCYVGLFGKGKTLSVVHTVVFLYHRYHNKKIYDTARKKWVTQKVHVISNVELSIPYERFVGLAQVVQAADSYKKLDEENDTLTVHLVLGDEFSVQLNSRSFKTNINPLFLNTLLTCRHHHISLFYTAQRFGHVDALLRQVTSVVISCNKSWRIMVQDIYDAYDMENAGNPLDVKPLRRTGWFIRQRDFNAYDTLACVDNLKKSCESGDMLTEEEILALQQNTPSDMDSVQRPSRKFIRRKKKVS